MGQTDSMTPRDRLIAAVAGGKVDRLPFILHWGPWAETARRWKREGMSGDNDWRDLFDFDPLAVGVPVRTGVWPEFKHEVLADEGETLVIRDAHGVVKRDRKDGCSIPDFLDYPVKDRRTWQQHKWRFDPDTPGRFGDDWPQQAKRLKDSPLTVTIGFYPYGLFGGARTMMGAEECLLAMALEPELIEDINATLCNLWQKLLERVLAETRLDMIWYWEDMAGRQGSLISPAMFRRFMTPHYRKLNDLARRGGVSILNVDSDGFMHELTGLFLEAGLNAVHPYEVQAGNDISCLRRKHPGLCAMGGMDKRAMARDKAAIDAEIERVRAILPVGRYIPFPDHLIPPDVSWENYQYFVWRWKEMIGKR